MGNPKNEFNIIRFKQGESIFKEGDAGECAYLIRSGVVKIYRLVNNTKLSITHLRAGQIMGEMAVISSAPRSASAEAAENCELVKIDRKSLNKALENTLPVIKAMLDQLIHRFRLIDKQSTIKQSDKILSLIKGDSETGPLFPVQFHFTFKLLNQRGDDFQPKRITVIQINLTG